MNMSVGIITGAVPVEAVSVEPGAPTTGASQSPVLPEPVERMLLSDDAIQEIAALLARTALDDRKDARRMRTATEKTIASQTRARIHELREKADAMRAAAWVSGASGMAAGACSVAGASKQLETASKLNTAGQLTQSQQTANAKLLQQAPARGQLGSGLGQITQGAGTLVAGAFQHAASEHETNAAEHEALAGRAERAVDEHSDEMAAAAELLCKVMDFLKDVRASQNGAAQAAILRG
jgi:hypothetical protein